MTRDEILQAAAQIFRRKGYHAASMQDIADAVQLQKASLYHHIESKQDILLALLDRAMDLLIEDMERIVETDQPPVAKLRRAMRTYARRMAEQGDLAAVLLLEYRNLEPELRAKHVDRRDRFEGLWRGILQQGSEGGEFRPVDPAVAGFAVLGVQNWMITWYRPNGPLGPEELADQFADLLIDGLRVPMGGDDR
ncbi:MAG: TetR/AcrR family transcriptional regulator [Anaerolineales bacterium]|nr:TetR/AcrR family transcriptional regulator [Anaerolineales bacterium]